MALKLNPNGKYIYTKIKEIENLTFISLTLRLTRATFFLFFTTCRQLFGVAAASLTLSAASPSSFPASADSLLAGLRWFLLSSCFCYSSNLHLCPSPHLKNTVRGLHSPLMTLSRLHLELVGFTWVFIRFNSVASNLPWWIRRELPLLKVDFFFQ